jgi:hypothetical protein
MPGPIPCRLGTLLAAAFCLLWVLGYLLCQLIPHQHFWPNGTVRNVGVCAKVTAMKKSEPGYCLPCDLRELAFIEDLQELSEKECNLTVLTHLDLALALGRHPKQAWFAMLGDSVSLHLFNTRFAKSPFFSPTFDDSKAWEEITWKTFHYVDHLICCPAPLPEDMADSPQGCIAKRSLYDYNETTAELVQMMLGEQASKLKYCISWAWNPVPDMDAQKKLQSMLESEFVPSAVIFNMVLHPARWYPRRRFNDEIQKLLDIMADFKSIQENFKNGPFMDCTSSEVSPRFIFQTGTAVKEEYFSRAEFFNHRINLFNSDATRLVERYRGVLDSALILDVNRLMVGHKGTKFVNHSMDGIHPIMPFHEILEQLQLNIVVRELSNICVKDLKPLG